jgi:phosphatidylserine decarboxylase
MAKTVQQWVETEVRPALERPQTWLCQNYFFRDPGRPETSDPGFFLSPADGILLYQKVVDPDECVLDIKGMTYSARDALRDPSYDRRSVVIGIFMTFYDVHVNRIPYPGRLSYRMVEAIDSLNRPMLDMEKALLEQLRVSPETAGYLRHNQRMVNRIDAPALGLSYFVLQIADYDVNSIMPFELRQNRPVHQGRRFSQIRYGSQVDLIVPLSDRCDFEFVQPTGVHVEAGIDPLLALRSRRRHY